jgi:hypothetical protein
MSDLLELLNAIVSHAIPDGVFRVNEEYRILFTSEEGTEDGLRVLLFIYMGEYYGADLSAQRIVIFFQFIGHVGN